MSFFLKSSSHSSLSLPLPLCVCSYQTQVILLSALQWHKERIWSIAMKLKPEKESISHCRTPLRYITSRAGASTGVWGRDTNECLSVRVWWRHVGILSDYRAAVVSLAMLRKSKRSIAPLNQLKMLPRSHPIWLTTVRCCFFCQG